MYLHDARFTPKPGLQLSPHVVLTRNLLETRFGGGGHNAKNEWCVKCPIPSLHTEHDLLAANKTLEPRQMILFFRLLRFYKTFIVLSALVGSLSLNILSYNEFHPTVSAQTRVAEGFLVSSASTSVISGMLATMLRFRFEDQGTASHTDYALAWLPLVILDWSIVAFLLGLLLWYGEKSNVWRTTIVGSQTAALLLLVCGVAAWMWVTMRRGRSSEKEVQPS